MAGNAAAQYDHLGERIANRRGATALEVEATSTRRLAGNLFTIIPVPMFVAKAIITKGRNRNEVCMADFPSTI